MHYFVGHLTNRMESEWNRFEFNIFFKIYRIEISLLIKWKVIFKLNEIINESKKSLVMTIWFKQNSNIIRDMLSHWLILRIVFTQPNTIYRINHMIHNLTPKLKFKFKHTSISHVLFFLLYCYHIKL